MATERVRNDFLLYWLSDQITNLVSDGLLEHAASDQFGRIAVGDTVWIVGPSGRGVLVLASKIDVGTIISQREANKYFGQAVYKSRYHVLPPKGGSHPAREINLSSVLGKLRFDSPKPKLDLKKPLAQQVQAMRKLTPESASLLEELWDGEEIVLEREYDGIQRGLDGLKDLDAKKTVAVRREQGPQSVWVVKCRENLRKGEGWHWKFYFNGNDVPFQFGGSDWIRSTTAPARIKRMQPEDLVVCYQTERRAIVGLTQIASYGYSDLKSGKLNSFDLVRADDAFSILDSPLTIQELRDQGCDPKKAFRPGTQGTVFEMSEAEFNSLLAVIGNLHPERKLELSELVGGLIPSGPEKSVVRRQGAGFGSAEQNRRVEQRAVEVVSEKLKNEGWKVRSVESEDVGYDLDCRKGKQRKHVEVKGVSGASLSFIISENEVATSKKDEDWWVYIVTGALSRKPKCHIHNSEDFSTKHRLKPINYIAEYTPL